MACSRASPPLKRVSLTRRRGRGGPGQGRQGRCAAVIVVAGEALIDLVVSAGGQLDARPGGGPYNAARTLARLGAETTFLGRLADDGFGRLLRDRLDRGRGGALAFPRSRTAPTTLAVVAVDQAGSASYSFYLDGTTAADLEYDGAKEGCSADGVTVLHVGDPRPGHGADGRGHRAADLRRHARPARLVLLDPNCRPSAVADHEAYRRRIGVIARRADIVKASTEDLAYLYPDVLPEEAAKALLDGGPSLVLVATVPHVQPVPFCQTQSWPRRSRASPWRTPSARATPSEVPSSPGGRSTASARPTSAAARPARDALVRQGASRRRRGRRAHLYRAGADPPTLAELRQGTGGRSRARFAVRAPSRSPRASRCPRASRSPTSSWPSATSTSRSSLADRGR